MSGRLVFQAAAASSSRLVRPNVGVCIRAMRPAMIAATGFRHYSDRPDPKVKANAIIEALPGSSVLSKTGILATGTAAAVYAISSELYIFNAESVILGSLLILVAGFAKMGGPAYRDWAEGQIAHIRGVLTQARKQHTAAVEERIETVGQLKDVVNVTKSLFDVSKETANLEAEVYTLQQKVDVVNEARSVLDSWVRYEHSVRQRDQKALAESVIGKIRKEISNPKFQQQVLQQAVTDVEKVFSSQPKA